MFCKFCGEEIEDIAGTLFLVDDEFEDHPELCEINSRDQGEDMPHEPLTED